MHLKLNRRHKIDWEGTRIIDKERRWDNRKIKESLFINAVDQSGNTKKLMNLEAGWELCPIWNAFNARVRMQMERSKM